ncbi:RHS repeat-associated core domain-containing protein [Erwinia sp. ErVv1]|uniref:RHS repeat-associated core domain-containing protein n=1 Tax=Erwinia sp. ErVv1 TaxID=1603299 RepID=UPI0008298965|nr:RHS repeat-associated core domain-containing protein [Erwinia sp. ErVv1]
MSTTLFSKTPSVVVFDNRALTVRNIVYHRHPDAPTLTDERISRYQYHPRGFMTQSADPRLFKASLVNLTCVTDLTGNVLHTQSVDAGIAVTLHDTAGRPSRAVTNINADEEIRDESQTLIRTWQYERPTLAGRLLSTTEQVGQAVRITDRFIWSGHSKEEKAFNLTGQCVSHYDTAGLIQINSIGLSGGSLSVTRRLLKEMNNEEIVANWEGDAISAWDDRLDDRSYSTLTRADATGSTLIATDASGNQQRVVYDIAGLLSGSWLTIRNEPEQVIVKSLTWSAAGQKLREEHGNGVVTLYRYEPETQRLTGIKTERPAGHHSGRKVLQDLRYQYDPVGNVLSIRNDAEETRFWRNQKVVPENTCRYDSLYQLVSATGREMANMQQNTGSSTAIIPLPTDSSAFTPYTRSYHYDNAGNLTQIRHAAPATSNTYTTDVTISNRSNRGVLSALTTNPTVVDSLFTAAGQQKQLQPGQKLDWTLRGELRKVMPVVRNAGANDSEMYRYDSTSQRLLKVTRQQTGNSTQKQQVIYLPGLELRTRSTGSSLTENLQVITLDGLGRAQLRILHWESGKPDGIGNNMARWSYDNLSGSSGLEVDDDGNVISLEEYYPFGGTALWTARSQTESHYKTIRFAGKERDATGLYYYGYRYYQPWAARWLSSDPAGTVDGLNLFRMVRNNPLSYSDSDGRMPFFSGKKSSLRQNINNEVQAEISAHEYADIPKSIHMIWIGSNKISDKNVALSLDTASMNPDYQTQLIYDSSIENYKQASDDLVERFRGSNVNVTDLRTLPSFSEIQSHPAFKYYTNTIREGRYAQASDLLRLLVLKHEGGIYKDVDDTQRAPFGDLSLYGGIGFKKEYIAKEGEKEQAVPNTPIGAARENRVINRTLDIAVERYQRGETNVFKLAGPDVFTEALYSTIKLSNLQAVIDGDKKAVATLTTFMDKILRRKIQGFSDEQYGQLVQPRDNMLSLGRQVDNGSDHSWK